MKVNKKSGQPSSPPARRFTETTHISCNRSPWWSEITGSIDTGTKEEYFLSRFHFNLRPGREREDFERMLSVLTRNKEELLRRFS